MKVMCIKCGLEMKTHNIGVYVVEMAGDRAYKTWPADEQACGGCDNLIVASWGAARYHHDGGFEVALVKMLVDHPEKIRICWEYPSQVRPIEDGIKYLLGKYNA